jgi:aldehyde:ferredoxin oxidoreductase
MVGWLNQITGWDIDISEFMKIGERVFNLKRMFNTRLGISRKDDFLPPRFSTRKRVGEDLTNQLPPIGRLLSDYYEYRNWTEEGTPNKEKIAELGLTEIIE